MRKRGSAVISGVFVAIIVFAISAVGQAAVGQAAVEIAVEITDVSPTSGRHEQTLDVRIRGSETNFADGVSQATFSGSGITVNSTSVVDATHAIANIRIDETAEPGSRDVNVITGAEVPAPLTDGFAVGFPAPTVTAITPSLGVNDWAVDITDLAGTNFREGAAVTLEKSGETDIEAIGVTVVSAEKITCSIDITGADDGHWDVVVENTDGESGRLKDGFEIIDSIPQPAISLVKTGPDEATPGDAIVYTFTVKNTGNDDLLNVSVTDSLLWEGAHHIGTLVQNDTATFQKSYTIPESTTGTVDNDGTAYGSDGAGNQVSDKNSHTVDLVTGFLTLLKLGPGSAETGDTITYDFTVYNNGSEALTDVSVTDPVFGAGWSHEIGDLAAYARAEFSNDYTLTDADTIPFTNTATVTATDAYGLEVTDTSSYTVIAPSPPGSCTTSIIGSATSRMNAWWASTVILLVGLTALIRHRYYHR